MPVHIRITDATEKQLEAAKIITKLLSESGCRVAFIGGFAMALLGSDRKTQMNLLIELAKDLSISDAREMVMRKDPSFVKDDAGIHFYKVDSEEYKELVPNDPAKGIDAHYLLRHASNNVLIETLPVGQLGLPLVAGPLLENDISGLSILHPKVLILTKLKRWCTLHESTRPKTRLKAQSDRHDINFLVELLVENKLHIAFDEYTGKPREQLLKYVRIYWAQLKLEENHDGIEALRKILKPDDLEYIVLSQQQEDKI
ncbi:hypothetical protein PQX77_010759 [Marasmius sp. AFHP31]|nr:hypothetical protein PQX77_010759 [Marasmius sp. AFHP31]